MSNHLTGQSTPPNEGSAPINISGGSSPHLSKDDDLARRCRQLARSVGHGAVVEQQHGSISINTSSLGPAPASPGRASSNASPARSPRSASLSMFPHSPNGQILPPTSPGRSYPTPEGSFILGEIQEEGEGDQLRTAAAAQAPLASALSTDEEHSDDGGRGRTSRSGPRLNPLNSLKLAGQNLEEALLRSSLKDGVSHFEVDLTLVDGELLVGSDPTSLSPESTLSSMYIEPLLSIFQPPQPPTPSSGTFYHHRRRSSSSLASHPFPLYAQQPLLLLVNLKTEPSISLQYLLYSITPLYDASLLTSYCANADLVSPGLVTIVCAGVDSKTREEINSISPRYVFAEGQLDDGQEEDDKMDGGSREVCPVTIGDLQQAVGWRGAGSLSEEQKLRVREQVERAHARGSKVLYRGVNSSTEVKEELRQEGVDYL